MNPVEIEQAVSHLFEATFDVAEFPYRFLEAFGNKASTLDRLRRGETNKSDCGGVLQTANIHIATCSVGDVTATLQRLRQSPATARAKARYILATDGEWLEAENLGSDEAPVLCAYPDLPNHFGYFLQLAGIRTVRQIRESSFDIRATSRFNRLYMQLLKDNPDWGRAERRADMNHFMARLIFCFFAEDTDIFNGDGLFTATVEQYGDRDAANTHWVISEIFRAMNTKIADRLGSGLRPWADQFPFVNGGLFSGSVAVPRFSRIARSYLLTIGRLDWKKINPDIFGSMIQAVADEAERGALGMHYTSMPNILKVLNPLFLDDLRDRLAEAGENGRMLLNLRRRMARIRVFDPACGSGNFLVIAYKEMRTLEAEINRRRAEEGRKSEIPLTNFRGIELRDFPAEIARLALIIAEFQCDVIYRGQKDALKDFLPLDKENWIACGNALRLDWLAIFPPTGTAVKTRADDLFETPLDQAEIDFENEGGETYICGNPPYLGSTWQSAEQKADLEQIFKGRTKSWKSLDYVAGWFMKAADYGQHTKTVSAFVSTNSICQGQQVPILWPLIFGTGHEIAFAHTSFKWSNLASNKAGVTVVIVGLSKPPLGARRLFDAEAASEDSGSGMRVRDVENINAYLVGGADVIVEKSLLPISNVAHMVRGNMPYDGGNLLLTHGERAALELEPRFQDRVTRRIYGSAEFIRGLFRYCLWIYEEDLQDVLKVPAIRQRIDAVRSMRLASNDRGANEMASRSHQFREMNIGSGHTLVVAAISSENREQLPCGIIDSKSVITNKNYALYDAPLWNMALIASRLHWVWIGTVCVRLEMRFSYSNTLGWNTFPVPTLTEKNREDLTRCAEDILLAREAHFPATIADLYDPKAMPEDLRAAHERNDEVLERIYIGRRFRNDTERLEKLFQLYSRMTSSSSNSRKPGASR